MREHGLQPKFRRRFVATTDSDHNGPIFPNLAGEFAPTGPDQLWQGDKPTVSSMSPSSLMPSHGWSSTLAALKTAIECGRPPAGCSHHSDRGSQYAAESYRQHLSDYGLAGSIGRRGNPYDNAKVESFMKTLKVEGIYPMAFETDDEVVEHLPDFIENIYSKRRLHSALGYLNPQQFEDQHIRQTGKNLRPPQGAHSTARSI